MIFHLDNKSHRSYDFYFSTKESALCKSFFERCFFNILMLFQKFNVFLQ